MPVAATLSQFSLPDAPSASIVEAVWRAVVYADIFDFPLTREEIGLFLPTVADQVEVKRAIENLVRDGVVAATEGYVYLVGRAEIVPLRRHRGAVARAMWPRAQRYARLLWAMPFVRMVAITGSLAVGNIEPDHDIDVLLVTAPGRLWLVRAMAIALAKFARLRGDQLCPNYLISSANQAFEPQDLYAAHEYVHMIPLHGSDVARELRAANTWYRDYLPQAILPVEEMQDGLPRPLAIVKRLGETLLDGALGNKLEAWERDRKIAKLTTLQPASLNEAIFGADMCKGHCHGHGARVARLFRERLAAGYRR